MGDRRLTSSIVSLRDDKKSSVKDGSTLFVNKQVQLQNDIDDFIRNLILSISKYDPKLEFSCSPIATRDQVTKQIRRQTYGLIWTSIRKPGICQLIPDGTATACIQVLHSPPTWSRYDTDILLIPLKRKTFLNGLMLRDEFLRSLTVILKRDYMENDDNKSIYEYKGVEFTRNSIQIVFSGRANSDQANLTLVVSLLILLEFDEKTTFFDEAYKALAYHEPFRDYLATSTDVNCTRLTALNPLKFIYDYNVFETRLCEYLVRPGSTTSDELAVNGNLGFILTAFMQLRKQWSRYLPRATKYATESTKTNDKRRQSACSVASLRSNTSVTSNLYRHMTAKRSLTSEIELSFEIIFSIQMLRVLFFKICCTYHHFPSDRDAAVSFAIEKGLHVISESLESGYLEHPFYKGVNIIPDAWITYDIVVKVGIMKLIKEMQREWKRGRLIK